jgi:hypothetical protein
MKLTNKMKRRHEDNTAYRYNPYANEGPDPDEEDAADIVNPVFDRDCTSILAMLDIWSEKYCKDLPFELPVVQAGNFTDTRLRRFSIYAIMPGTFLSTGQLVFDIFDVSTSYLHPAEFTEDLEDNTSWGHSVQGFIRTMRDREDNSKSFLQKLPSFDF